MVEMCVVCELAPAMEDDSVCFLCDQAEQEQMLWDRDNFNW